MDRVLVDEGEYVAHLRDVIREKENLVCQASRICMKATRSSDNDNTGEEISPRAKLQSIINQYGEDLLVLVVLPGK